MDALQVSILYISDIPPLAKSSYHRPPTTHIKQAAAHHHGRKNPLDPNLQIYTPPPRSPTTILQPQPREHRRTTCGTIKHRIHLPPRNLRFQILHCAILHTARTRPSSRPVPKINPRSFQHPESLPRAHHRRDVLRRGDIAGRRAGRDTRRHLHRLPRHGRGAGGERGGPRRARAAQRGLGGAERVSRAAGVLVVRMRSVRAANARHADGDAVPWTRPKAPE